MVACGKRSLALDTLRGDTRRAADKAQISPPESAHTPLPGERLG